MEGVVFAACCMWYPQNSHRQCHRQSPRPKQLGELNVILRSYDKGQVGNLMQIRIQIKHIGLEWRDDSYHPQSSHNHNHPIIPWSFWRVCERRLAGPPRWWCNSAGIVKMNKPRRYNEGNYMELLYLTKLATHMCCPGGLIIQSWHCLLNFFWCISGHSPFGDMFRQWEAQVRIFAEPVLATILKPGGPRWTTTKVVASICGGNSWLEVVLVVSINVGTQNGCYECLWWKIYL